MAAVNCRTDRQVLSVVYQSKYLNQVILADYVYIHTQTQSCLAGCGGCFGVKTRPEQCCFVAIVFFGDGSKKKKKWNSRTVTWVWKCHQSLSQRGSAKGWVVNGWDFKLTFHFPDDISRRWLGASPEFDAQELCLDLMHFDVLELKVERVKDAERIKLKGRANSKMKCHPFKSTNILVTFFNSHEPFYSICLKWTTNEVLV